MTEHNGLYLAGLAALVWVVSTEGRAWAMYLEAGHPFGNAGGWRAATRRLLGRE